MKFGKEETDGITEGRDFGGRHGFLTGRHEIKKDMKKPGKGFARRTEERGRGKGSEEEGRAMELRRHGRSQMKLGDEG
jgi:hypothetical protein